MTEEALLFGRQRNLVGILTKPAADTGRDMALPTFLLLNAGIVHRVGPNRLHVKLARHLANLGFRSFRFDFAGIGDSPASKSTTPFDQRAVQEATEAMDLLLRTSEAQTFLALGICSGAEIAYSLAQQDDRVAGVILINGGFMDRNPSEENRRQAQAQLEARYYRRKLFDPHGWARVLRGKSNLKAIRRAVMRNFRSPWSSPGSPSDAPTQATSQAPESTSQTPDSDWLQRLAERNLQLLTIYSEGSVTWDLLNISPGVEALTAVENIQLELIENCDHVFTPLWAQARLVDLISQWATDVFTGKAPGPALRTSSANDETPERNP